jgi:hypothetical protein
MAGLVGVTARSASLPLPGPIGLRLRPFSQCASFRAGAILAGLVCALALGYSARAAPTSTLPRAALMRALSQVHRLATQVSNPLARHSADAVSRQLARALDPVLWLDPSEVVAPLDGARVFFDTTTALAELQGVSGPGAARAASAGGLVVRAARGLAAGIVAQAAGGDPGLLATATRGIAAGDHAAQAGRRTGYPLVRRGLGGGV